MAEGAVQLSNHGVARLKAGHPWIFRGDVRGVSPQVTAGGVVQVTDGAGRHLGYGFYSTTSRIALRMVRRGEGAVDREMLRARIDAACALREALPFGETYRLVHGEADGLPGLVVDRYQDVLVIQTLVQATERLKPTIVEILQERLQPRSIVERNDVHAREHEGLPLQRGVLAGEAPGVVAFAEGEVTEVADPLNGQKTGAFLDQRENRIAAGNYARGRALDIFSYAGAFAVHLARKADTVTAVDISEEALARGREAAERNGGGTIDFVAANGFDYLKSLDRAGERFDTIVLDPPAFAKRRENLARAAGGYKEINLRAIKLLRPGGMLISCSCSHHVSPALFAEILAAAAADARRQVQLVERRGASRDHPGLITAPETEYLKCFVLRVLG